jgi:hypothetical protein
MRITLSLLASIAAAPALALAQPSTEPTPDEPRPAAQSAAEQPMVYGTKGVREAGGSAGFMVAPEFHSVTVAPSFGWFIADRVQVSTILGLSNIRAGDSDATIISTVIEPSYHLQIDKKTLAFAGMGFGYAYVQDLGSGLTYTIRMGSQFLIGRTGVFAPSVSYDFRTNERDNDMPKLPQIASESALRINLGYTTIW